MIANGERYLTVMAVFVIRSRKSNQGYCAKKKGSSVYVEKCKINADMLRNLIVGTKPKRRIDTTRAGVVIKKG